VEKQNGKRVFDVCECRWWCAFVVHDEVGTVPSMTCLIAAACRSLSSCHLFSLRPFLSSTFSLFDLFSFRRCVCPHLLHIPLFPPGHRRLPGPDSWPSFWPHLDVRGLAPEPTLVRFVQPGGRVPDLVDGGRP
jgi:hypothetical protein